MGDINHDPSMEEILASIKRVIADDGRAALAAPRGRSAAPMPDGEDSVGQDEGVLELSDPMPEPIMSDDTASASRNALAALAAARRDEPPSAIGAEGPLEAAVREMLRPMLKAWLDERLPEIVEQLVTREISRITGKGG